MKHAVHIVGQEDEVRHVMLDEAEALIAREVFDVRDVARDEIIDPDDAVTFCKQSVGEMRTEKTSGPGND